MQFTVRKHRQAPAVIIISLIDILIVLLIFMMVTTSFRQTPALKLALPESKQPRQGTSSDAAIIVSIAKNEPRFYIDTKLVTFQRLQDELIARATDSAGRSMPERGNWNFKGYLYNGWHRITVEAA